MTESKRPTVKVRVPITVEVDVERWNREYWTKDGASQIRSMVYNQVFDAAVTGFGYLAEGPEPIVTLKIG